jgi:hypothetical protein
LEISFVDFGVADAAVITPSVTVTDNSTGSWGFAGLEYVTVSVRVNTSGLTGLTIGDVVSDDPVDPDDAIIFVSTRPVTGGVDDVRGDISVFWVPHDTRVVREAIMIRGRESFFIENR